MARYTKNGSNVVNTWEGYTVTWYCKQVTDITVNTTTVDVTINVYAHFNNTANIYGGDMNGALVVDNKIVNRANPPDYHTAQDNEDWHLISRKVTYTRGTSEATHTISSWVAVTGGAWEGTSSNYNNRLTITIPILPYYAISYNANGGTDAPSVGRKWYNQEYTVSSTKPTRTGYTFSRWKIKETGNTVSAGGKISADSNANYTLVAEWSRNSYTLTYNANGGSVSPASKTVSYGYSYGSLPDATHTTRTGHEFKGWFTASSGGSQVSSSTTMGASNTTIYAQWTAKPYTLTYNAHGGDVSPTSKSVVYNTDYGNLPTPTLQYHNFIGWFTEESGGLQVSSSTKMGAADVTIHAQWELAYIPPSLYISNAKRARKEGTRYVEDDTGTIANVTFTWSDGDNSGTPISPDTLYDIILTEQVDENPEVITASNLRLTSSPVSVYLDGYSISAEKSFDVEVILHVTGHDDVSAHTYISQAFFIMDINANGTAIGFGGAVEDYIKTKDTTIVQNKDYYILETVDENTIYTKVAEPTTANLSNYYEVNKGLYLADKAGVFRALFDYLYPVGSYYETSDSTFDPNVTWGGTWILETEGLVHIGAGNNYTLGDTGGNKDAIIPYHRHSYTAPPSSTNSHTLIIDEIPSHSHSFTYAQYQRGTGSSTASALEYSGSTKTTDSKGGGKGHSHTISGSSSTTGDVGTPGNLTNANMQPYVVVNRWHRTA